MAREGRTIRLRAGGWPAASAPRALASGSRRWARQSLDQGPQVRRASARPAPQRRPDSAGERRVVFGPYPARTGPGDRDPGREAPERTTTPQCSPSGSAAFGPHGQDDRPRRLGRHQRAARLGSRPDWRPGLRARRDLGRAWSGTRPARCLPARAGASDPRTASPARPGQVPWAWFPPAGRAGRAPRSIRGVGLARWV